MVWAQGEAGGLTVKITGFGDGHLRPYLSQHLLPGVLERTLNLSEPRCSLSCEESTQLWVAEGMEGNQPCGLS